jgi:2-keto-4-pentenoate hydratase
MKMQRDSAMDDGLRARAAQFMWEGHARGADYVNLPAELRPASIEEAYGIQDAFHEIARRSRGAIVGWKIATTTKVMQKLMGIDHPCAGAIFEATVHRSPARLRGRDFISLKIECELAFRLAGELPSGDAPCTAAGVLGAIEAVMPAFEIVDDRNAVYRDAAATSLIADNCWNEGVVLGEALPLGTGLDFSQLAGRLQITGGMAQEGFADGPLEALAWVANLVASRRSRLRRGMIVMTGSLIPTAPLLVGQTARFEVAGLGEVRLSVD